MVQLGGEVGDRPYSGGGQGGTGLDRAGLEGEDGERVCIVAEQRRRYAHATGAQSHQSLVLAVEALPVVGEVVFHDRLTAVGYREVQEPIVVWSAWIERRDGDQVETELVVQAPRQQLERHGVERGPVSGRRGHTPLLKPDERSRVAERSRLRWTT